MKSLQEILLQEPVYMNFWDSKESVLRSFDGDRWDWDSKNKVSREVYILFASYGCANYEGDAFVLLEREGKLFEVHGGHCSCYGLEGQWDEEETSLEELERRLLEGTFGENDWSENDFKGELCEFLGVEFRRNRYKY